MTGDRSVATEAAQVSARAAEVALCLDFDGTLAPIVDDPDTARPLAGVEDLLTRLASRYAAVALLSGRPATYLARRITADGVRYLGLYGLQEMRDGHLHVDPGLEAARPAVVAAGRDLQAATAVRTSGAHLEDKEYAVAVHTRRVPDPEAAAAPIEAAVTEIAERRGLEVIRGRLVWELRPAVRADKGDAVRRVVGESGARAVVVAGDDLGDLPAFAAAEGLAEEGYWALRVAVRSPEAPPALLERADLVVEGPAGVRDLLERLTA